jgi:hypothetical protein
VREGALAGARTAGRSRFGLAGAWLLAAGVACLFSLVLVAALSLAGAPALVRQPVAFGASSYARVDIPARYRALYVRAARRYGLDWTILAGIGKVECDHGRDPDPSCTRESAVNFAGAGGPAQFLSSTWATYGVDGDGDGRADRWDPADAVFAMARYLRAAGAPADYRAAIFAYDHADWYVADVERWANVYRGVVQPTTEADATYESVELVQGDRAELAPGSGHVALVPAGAPPVVRAMVIAGNELQDLPYGSGGHPDPRGADSEDCSSTVNYVLYRSGVRPISEILRDNPLAQDYLGWGEPGPGRWVTIYATAAPTDHVFVVIAGLRLDTSHRGTDTGPNRAEDGPRWRVFDRIPGWAHWSVRHPPGL